MGKVFQQIELSDKCRKFLLQCSLQNQEKTPFIRIMIKQDHISQMIHSFIFWQYNIFILRSPVIKHGEQLWVDSQLHLQTCARSSTGCICIIKHFTFHPHVRVKWSEQPHSHSEQCCSCGYWSRVSQIFMLHTCSSQQK